jgi:hypothetical protein
MIQIPSVTALPYSFTEAQASAIRCALADLQGALQSHERMDRHTHDWDAHALSIQELIENFPLILDKQ